MDRFIIETERLILRNYNENDFNDYFDYIKSDDVCPRLGYKPYSTKKSALERLKIEISKPYQFAITLKPNNKVIGSVELMDIHHPEKFVGIKLTKECKDITYLLSPKYWGQGITPEAVKGLLALAFKVLNVPIIAIGHDSANFQSGRVQDKIGFKIVGETPTEKVWIDGKVHSSILRIMTKEDYFSNPDLANFNVKITNLKIKENYE